MAPMDDPDMMDPVDDPDMAPMDDPDMGHYSP